MTTFTSETYLESSHKVTCVVSQEEYEGKVLSLCVSDNDTKETLTTFLSKPELLELINTLTVLSKLMKD